MKRKIALLVLLLVCVGAAGMFIYHRMEIQRNLESQLEAEELARSHAREAIDALLALPREWRELPVENDPFMELLKQADLAALQAVNADVLGWLEIPDTQLKYPMVRGLDNTFYLKHDWKKQRNIVGAAFLERLNQEDFSDFHSLIYGHRLVDGGMFGSLGNYSEQSYWEAHPYVYIYDEKGAHRYEIFSAYEASVKSLTYQVGFSGEESKMRFLEHCMSSSVIDTGVVPTLDDRILTLSTCTASGSDAKRWVVQACLRGQ